MQCQWTRFCLIRCFITRECFAHTESLPLLGGEGLQSFRPLLGMLSVWEVRHNCCDRGSRLKRSHLSDIPVQSPFTTSRGRGVQTFTTEEWYKTIWFFTPIGVLTILSSMVLSINEDCSLVSFSLFNHIMGIYQTLLTLTWKKLDTKRGT